jgi:hypothetical protein
MGGRTRESLFAVWTGLGHKSSFFFSLSFYCKSRKAGQDLVLGFEFLLLLRRLSRPFLFSSFFTLRHASWL